MFEFLPISLRSKILASCGIMLLIAGTTQHIATAATGDPQDDFSPGSVLRKLNTPARVEHDLSAKEWLHTAWNIGGGSPESWPRIQAGLDRRVTAAESAVRLAGDQSQRGVVLLDWLHRNLLLSYDVNATEPSAPLESGRYNCVSASIVYRYFARELGIDAQGLCRDKHCRIALFRDPEFVILETTCASCRGNAAVVGKLTPELLRHERLITDSGLLALICFNRAVDLARAEKYQAAVEENLTALAYDHRHDGARANLIAVLNHLAIESCARNDFATGESWLEVALIALPGDETTRHNLEYVRRKSDSGR